MQCKHIVYEYTPIIDFVFSSVSQTRNSRLVWQKYIQFCYKFLRQLVRLSINKFQYFLSLEERKIKKYFLSSKERKYNGGILLTNTLNAFSSMHKSFKKDKK